MSNIDTSARDDGSVKFFGQLSASATHEIKNKLAIINESAGLLEDLCGISENGTVLPGEKILEISSRIKRQVVFADKTLKMLNRFSHSMDTGQDLINLHETLEFVLQFTKRLIAASGCQIHVDVPAWKIVVTASLFDLQHLIWRVIESICYNATHKDQICISFGNDPAVPSIWFSSALIKAPEMENLIESPADKALINRTGVLVEKKINKGSVGLLWTQPV